MSWIIWLIIILAIIGILYLIFKQKDEDDIFGQGSAISRTFDACCRKLGLGA